ncbi:MAG TPA: shikimate kinase [Smithella sp.]|nr:shikimate kinase [Smithella sp.]
MKIVLIGYRATGKTTAGRILSDILKVPYWDTDFMIQRNMGMSIKDMVETKGWEYFRAKEKEVIRFLAKKGDCVIAGGGGMVLDRENVDLLKQTGLFIWLNSPAKDIVERLKNDVGNAAARPPFSGADLEQETAEMLQQRVPLYQRVADYTVDTAGKSAIQIVEEIYQYLLKSGNLDKIEKN